MIHADRTSVSIPPQKIRHFKQTWKFITSWEGK